MSQHEHAPLTRHEETELARIGQRLERDGIVLDRALSRPEWPFQVAGVVLAAIGGMLVASAAFGGDEALLVFEVVAGSLMVAAAAAAGVTPVRRWILRGATAAHWRLTSRLRSPHGRWRRRLRGRRRSPT